MKRKRIMKLSSYIAFSLFALASFTSCEMREEIKGGSNDSGMGLLELSVQVKSPVVTKAAVSTDDFPVSIIGKSVDGEEVERVYDAVAELPESILLPVGTYSVISHTKGQLGKKMEFPYYKGCSDMEIKKDITSSAKVTCKMQNSRIQLNYSMEFLAKFASWTIVLDDGSETALSITETSASASTSPAPIYWYFGDNGAETVTLNIRAKTIEGNTVTMAPYVFKKEDAAEKYDDVDNPNFTGGEALIIDLKPGNEEDPTTGTVKGISVTISVIFENHDEVVDIPVEDKEETKPDPDPDQGEVSVILPEDFTYSLSGIPEKPASADAILKAPAGMKSALVKIVTDNGEFKTTLQDAAFDEPGALLIGANLIGNKGIQDLFNSLELKETDGSAKKTPVEGATEYIFPIATFFTFLDMFTGTHQFYITLTDINDKEVEKVLTITITE